MKYLVLLMSFGLMSCGVGLEDSSGPNVDREIKNDKLRAEYDGVRGTYDGFIRLTGSSRRFPVKLFIWTGEIQEAPSPGDLKPGVRVVLRGRLMQQNFIGDSDNLIMTGQFDALTGRVRLDPDAEVSKTSTGCRLGGQDPITVSAIAGNGSLSGTILRNGQEWASLEDTHRTSTEVNSGSVLSEEQEYQRLLQTYAPVVGMYEGKLNRNVCNANRAEDFEAWLYVERVPEGTGLNNIACFIPRLSLRALRNYSGEYADVTYRSINRFNPDKLLPQFISSTDKYNTKVDLDVVNGKLVGQISTTGRWGTFEVRRVADQVVAPEDEGLLLRERRERTYRQFTGLFRGTNKAYSGPNWPVKLQLYIDEKEDAGVRVPVLMALYTRPDFSDETIGQRLMEVDVSIDGCKPVLAMKSDARPGNGNIPGVGLMRYDATWTNGTLEGELVDHRGPQGVLTVKKR